MGWLDGEVALITGAGSGLGRALVERFLEEGAHVGALERSPEKAQSLRDDFGDAIAVSEGDVSQYADNARAVEATVAKFGKLDTFIGNAGIWDFSTPFGDVDGPGFEKSFDELFGVNVKGCILGTRAALDALRASRGSAIYTASNAAFFPGGGGVLYTSSKHALLGVTRQLAYELAPEVRVNCVCPGGMRTDLRGPQSLGLENLSFGDMLPPGTMAKFAVLEFDIEARDYAGAYVLLASRQNAPTATGTIIDLSGVGVSGGRERRAMMAQMRGQAE
jgi:NAD(P)-dependent dehydrogenase (short-subunit alcohol dehydrogenase family)